MATPAGERRVVSVLLADIAGSTTIAEQLGAERSKFLFDEVVRLIAGDVKRFGGTVAQLTGDGLYALFGVPSAHEDDAERAVRAALRIHGALAGYAKEVREAYGIELAARIGVNTGPVVLLAEEAPAEERYNALGDTVNVAARLQQHSGPGGVAIGAATARQVEAVFELESLGALELKGKADIVEAFRVAGEREAAERLPSPLVGRVQELAALDEVLGDLADGRGAIVAITGEPGIGKSRLVAEARARFEDRVRFLGAQGVSYAQDVPYYPLRELLRGFLGLGVADPEARVRLELKTRLAAVLGTRAEDSYPFLASLLGLVLEDDARERLQMLARDSVQRQTHEAVTALLQALSRERPLCLALEDLHFADEPTLELCEELLPLAEQEVVVLLLVYRPDPDLRSWDLGEAARRRFRHRFRELALEPLDLEHGALLATSAAGKNLPAGLAAELAERTGGNPLFLEEAAREAAERGNGAVVPAAIQETLQARLGRLAPASREVAAVASVVGRTFAMPLLERLVEPEQLQPALSELQRLDLVVEERRRPAREYRFRHGLVQEAAYATLLDERRRDLHRLVGEALEDLHGDELSEAYGLLARHFAEADEPEKAARYLLEAGDAARVVYADEEAIAQYRRALTFLDRLDDAGRARQVLFKIALSHHVAFDFEAANEAWIEAARHPEPPPRRLEPTKRIETSLFRTAVAVPGHGYHVVSWLFAPNLFRGLLRFDRGFEVVPDLAEQVSVSPDGRVFRFLLRQGERWSDGQPLTADDFAFTYRTMQEQAVGTANLLGGVEAEAVDARTLELRFVDPRPYTPYLLASMPFFPWPRHQVAALGDAWREPAVFVGNGPFTVVEADDDHARLVASPEWTGVRGNVAEIDIAFRAPVDVAEDWREGRFDYLMELGRLPSIAGAPNTVEVPVPLPGTRYISFGHGRPPLDDERVRRALAHGLDRVSLTRGTRLLPALGGLIPPAMPGHSHDLGLPFDLDRARTLLAEAGYPNGRGLPELQLLHADIGFSDSYRRVEEARWQQQWGELGVRLRQEWRSWSDPRDFAAQFGDADLLEWGWNADYPDPDGMLGSLLESVPVSRDAETEALLARARALRSRDERLALYRAADRRLVAEQVLMVVPCYDSLSVVHRPWIEGFWGSPVSVAPLSDIVVRDR
jgi:ABC-type transport system substrate-binding protein/class 3 adenylate cyclase